MYTKISTGISQYKPMSFKHYYIIITVRFSVQGIEFYL